MIGMRGAPGGHAFAWVPLHLRVDERENRVAALAEDLCDAE